MSQTVDPLMAALFRVEGEQPPIVAAAAPPAAPSGPAPAAPPGITGSTAEALHHYRQALEALRNGDWQTFGAEMNALQKSLEGTAPPS
jgi:uncharacterized membrane protein (UPF0182 family)